MCRRSDHRESAAADIELDAEVAHLRAQLRRVERENRNLRGETEVLREAADPLTHQAPARERFAFICARRDRFSVKLLCRILVTDRGSYYAWVRARGERVEREHDDRRPTELILEVHSAYPAYGVPRVTRGLLRQYFPKGTDLSRWTSEDLEAVALAIDNRPRKILGWRTPAEVFEEQLHPVSTAGFATTP
jgi:hypothetical protein